jgi:hypothetical protein
MTNNYVERVKYHTSHFQSKKEYHKPLYKAMRKYGIEQFTFELLYEGLTLQEACDKEASLIKELHTLSHENGYNISPGNDYYNVTGERVNTAVLTQAEVETIIRRREAGERGRDVYADFRHRIGYSGFQSIWLGKTWKWLSGQNNVKIVKGNAKFSLEEIRRMKQLAKDGKSIKAIADIFHEGYHTIYNVIKGISYSYITV